MVFKKHVLLICCLCCVLGLTPVPLLAQSTATQSQSLNYSTTVVVPSSGNGGTSGSLGSSGSSYEDYIVRDLPVPGGSPLPNMLPVPSHFAPPVTDGSFHSLSLTIPYKDTFTLEDALALSNGRGKIRSVTVRYPSVPFFTPSSWIQVLLLDPKDKEQFKQYYIKVGEGNYKADDSESISEHVLGVALEEGLKIGADTILFREGAALVQTAKGWSLGLFNAFSWVSDGSGEGKGNATVGGTGYGRGQTAYAVKPWLQVQFFRSKNGAPVPQSSVPGGNQEVLGYQEGLKKARPPTPEESTLVPEPGGGR